MATLETFDKIRKVNTSERRTVTYTEYFSVMEISEKQKKRRVELADDLEEALLFFFAFYIVAQRYNAIVDRIEAENALRIRLEEAFAKNRVWSDTEDMFLMEITPEIVRVTNERYKEDPYWTSGDRAMSISRDGSNTVWNTQEYKEAVGLGKRHKQWLTMKDEKVRPTHVIVDDTIMPIDEPFVVGDSLMMYPMDTSLGASLSEISNCRCAVKYM